MDTALIVFIIGTVASFAPMYWLALRLLGRQRKRALARGEEKPAGRAAAGRREFLDLLRQEAGQRAVTVLRDALAEARSAAERRGGDHHALSAPTCQSLLEAGSLVDSLFPRELRKMFHDGTEMLMSATPASVGPAIPAVAVAIAAFERALEAGKSDASAAASRKPGFWAALRNRRRGWTGSADVGVTA